MTTNKKEYKCVSCDHVVQLDLGFAEVQDPSPEMHILAIPPEAPMAEGSLEAAESEEVGYDVLHNLAIGECTECGGNSWQFVGGFIYAEAEAGVAGKQ